MTQKMLILKAVEIPMKQKKKRKRRKSPKNKKLTEKGTRPMAGQSLTLMGSLLIMWSSLTPKIMDLK